MSQGPLARIVPTTDENLLHRLAAMLTKTGCFAKLLLTLLNIINNIVQHCFTSFRLNFVDNYTNNMGNIKTLLNHVLLQVFAGYSKLRTIFYHELSFTIS